MSKFVCSLSLFLCLFNACAFDDKVSSPTPGKHTESPAPKAPETKTPDSKVTETPKLQITWDTGQSTERSIKRNIQIKKDRPSDLFAENPITIPSYIPDALLIKIPWLPIPAIKSGKTVVPIVHVRQDSLTNKPFDLPVQESSVTFQFSAKGPSDIEFTILGFKGLLSCSNDKIEQKLFMTLELKFPESDSQTATVDLIFMTPPAFLEFNQWTLEQYESKDSTLPNEIKLLKTGNSQLSLLQILEIQNRSDQTLSLDVPVKIKAKLTQAVIDHPAVIDADLCVDQEEDRNLEEVLLDSIVVFPFNQSIGKDWYRWLEQGAINVRITPHNKMLFAIYGQQMEPVRKPLVNLLNERRSSVYMKAHPLKSAEIMLGCDFGCIWPNTSPAFEKHCDNLQSPFRENCNQRVAACLPCIKRFFDRPDRNNPVEFGNDCNQCHLLEYQEKDPFSYDRLGACVQGWRIRPSSEKTIQYGYEFREISLNVEYASAKVRYGHSTPDEDPSFRYVRFLKKSSVQVP